MIEIRISVAPDALRTLDNMVDALREFSRAKTTVNPIQTDKQPETPEPADEPPAMPEQPEESKTPESVAEQPAISEQPEVPELVVEQPDYSTLRQTVTTLLRQNTKTKKEPLKALLNKYGTNRISLLADDKLEAFLEELKEVLAA